ncbi:MAG: hypothetical protein HPZ91_15920 [Lentisphaeria bacterium]|nr:hypothetical protein [Lentisphaeria bacterium]
MSTIGNGWSDAGVDAVNSLPVPSGLKWQAGTEEEYTIDLSWNPIAGVGDNLECFVQIGRFSDFRDSSAWGESWGGDDSGSGAVLHLNKGTFYVRVRVRDWYSDQYGEWSAPLTVNVATAIPSDYDNWVLGRESEDGSELSLDHSGWNITVNDGGRLLAGNGGKARDCVVNSGGEIKISSDYGWGKDDFGQKIIFGFWNTFALNTVVNDGGMLTVKGGYAQYTTVRQGGAMTVYGIAGQDGNDYGYVPPEFREELITAYDTTLDGGTQTVLAGSVERTVVNAGGKLQLHGGRATSVTVNKGGVAEIRAYLSLDTPGEGGSLYQKHFEMAGRAVDMTVNGGTAYIYDGAEAAGTKIGSNGAVTVNAGGEVFSTTVNAGGSLIVLGSGRASGTVLNGGSVHVATGGLLDGVTVNSGRLYLYGGAILDGTVNVQGTVVLDDVAMNRGTVNLRVTSDSAAVPLINDLALLEGGALSVSVDAAKAPGGYSLAGNAAAYDRVVTVMAGGRALGSLTAGGDALVYGGFEYSLVLSGTELTLRVGGAAKPGAPSWSVSTAEPTNRDVEITAVFSGAAAVREYSLDGKTWQAYHSAVILSQNGTVYFREGDGFGVFGPVSSCTVSNIDKAAPEKPVLSASTNGLTYDIVTVSAAFSADSVKKEYSLDGKTWQECTGKVTMAQNGTVYFRGTDAAGNTSVSQYEVSNILVVSPDAPSTVSLAEKSSCERYNITLKWDKAATAGKPVKIAGYEISVNGETFTSKSTSFKLKNVELGSYCCMVRAIDSEGRVGRWSDAVTWNVADETAPTVKSLGAKVDGYTLALSWNGQDRKGGIVSYIVKYDGEVREKPAGDASGVTLTLSEADVGRHRIEVIAYDGVNFSKAASKSVTVKDATAPEQVTGLSAPEVRDPKYKAVLEWAPGMDNSGVVKQYLIRIDGGEKLQKSKKNSIDVKKLGVGTHTYQVCAVDGEKNTGAWSEEQTFAVHDVTAPKKVSAKASVTDNRVTLSWKTPKDNVGVAGYQVWFGATPSEMTLEAELGANQLNYDLGQRQQGNYSYAVCAIDAAGNVSDLKVSAAKVKTELAAAAELTGFALKERSFAAGNLAAAL